MTRAQIIEANREQHKGTFMDRSWRNQTNDDIYLDKTLSRW